MWPFKFRRRQDNCTFVANNILAFYLILRDNFGQSFRREQILFAAGLMDVFVYLEKGLITPDRVIRALQHAKRGECALRGKKITHAKRCENDDMSDYDPSEEELLLNFIMQLECVIMAVKRRRIKSVLRFIQNRKESLRECVSKGLQEGEKHMYYESLSEQAKMWFVEENMNRFVSACII